MKKNMLFRAICFLVLISIVGYFIIEQKENTDILNLYTLLQEEGETYELTVKNRHRKVIFQEQYIGEPSIEAIYDDTLLVIRGRGSWHIYTFINIETGLVSEGFSDIVAWNQEKAVYAILENGVIKIIVQAIYDKDVYYMEILRDFSSEAVPYLIILKAEFMNDSQLMLEYYSGENREVVNEIINLN